MLTDNGLDAKKEAAAEACPSFFVHLLIVA